MKTKNPETGRKAAKKAKAGTSKVDETKTTNEEAAQRAKTGALDFAAEMKFLKSKERCSLVKKIVGAALKFDKKEKEERVKTLLVETAKTLLGKTVSEIENEKGETDGAD